MLIDWFTVGAQALNFVVLIWLLKRFLYKPVLGAIDSREQKIAAKIADADDREAKALAAADTFKKKSEAFDSERAELLAQAREEASAERSRLLESARQAADTLSATRQQELRNEARSLSQAVAEQAQQEVFAITRRTLADLAGSSLEDRVADVFVRRLQALEDPALQTLLGALRAPDAQVVVRSAFDLGQEQQSTIEKAVNDMAGEPERPAIALQFETAAKLVSGIELVAGGQKLAWSIDNYLKSLEHAVGDLLGEVGSDDLAAKDSGTGDAEAAVQE